MYRKALVRVGLLGLAMVFGSCLTADARHRGGFRSGFRGGFARSYGFRGGFARSYGFRNVGLRSYGFRGYGLRSYGGFYGRRAFGVGFGAGYGGFGLGYGAYRPRYAAYGLYGRGFYNYNSLYSPRNYLAFSYTPYYSYPYAPFYRPYSRFGMGSGLGYGFAAGSWGVPTYGYTPAYYRPGFATWSNWGVSSGFASPVYYGNYGFGCAPY